jgi:hypothetical protein
MPPARLRLEGRENVKLWQRNFLISNFRVVPTRKLDLSKINATRFVLTVLVKSSGRPPKTRPGMISIYKGENLIEGILAGNQIKTGQTVSI